MRTTPGIGDLLTTGLITTYKSWDDPPSSGEAFLADLGWHLIEF